MSDSPETSRGATISRRSVLKTWPFANPKVSFAEYRKHRPGRPQDLGDRRLKSEGYAIVRVDPVAREFVLERWPWNVDPRAAGAPDSSKAGRCG